mmetsp:Transcript_31204/g.56815  ORF Transcript_31204/g.56815 Transcript_31204/m.56815 type:complete len:86 (+) Transcript_31204:47-304(+)
MLLDKQRTSRNPWRHLLEIAHQSLECLASNTFLPLLFFAFFMNESVIALIPASYLPVVGITLKALLQKIEDFSKRPEPSRTAKCG